MKDKAKIDFIDGQLDGDIDRRQMDGVSLQAKRKIVTGVCECGCGREFGGTVRRRFYNEACKKRAMRASKKDEQ